MSSTGSANEELSRLSIQSDRGSPWLAWSCYSTSSERTQDRHLSSFPSPMSRPNPASQPRTPAIKGSNGVQSPRLGFSCKYFELANRIPSLLRSSPWPRDREPRCALRSDDTDARKEARRCFGRSHEWH